MLQPETLEGKSPPTQNPPPPVSQDISSQTDRDTTKKAQYRRKPNYRRDSEKNKKKGNPGSAKAKRKPLIPATGNPIVQQQNATAKKSERPKKRVTNSDEQKGSNAQTQNVTQKPNRRKKTRQVEKHPDSEPTPSKAANLKLETRESKSDVNVVNMPKALFVAEEVDDNTSTASNLSRRQRQRLKKKQKKAQEKSVELQPEGKGDVADQNEIPRQTEVTEDTINSEQVSRSKARRIRRQKKKLGDSLAAGAAASSGSEMTNANVESNSDIQASEVSEVRTAKPETILTQGNACAATEKDTTTESPQEAKNSSSQKRIEAQENDDIPKHKTSPSTSNLTKENKTIDAKKSGGPLTKGAHDSRASEISEVRTLGPDKILAQGNTSAARERNAITESPQEAKNSSPQKRMEAQEHDSAPKHMTKDNKTNDSKESGGPLTKGAHNSLASDRGSSRFVAIGSMQTPKTSVYDDGNSSDDKDDCECKVEVCAIM